LSFPPQVVKYNELEELFELQVSKYPETSDTRRDLKLLKWVWDFKVMCDKLFESWKQQLWSEINTEALVDENKELLKHLRRQANDFQVRNLCGQDDHT